MRKYLTICFMVVWCIFATPPSIAHAEQLDDDYYISAYDFTADIEESNLWHVTETITFDFVQPHHGPTRIIPVSKQWEAVDNDEYVKGRLSNFKVTCDDAPDSIAKQQTSYTDNAQYKEYHIGSSSTTVTGEHTYVFTYDLQFFTDTPVLYYNIIGTQWECPIDNVTWSLTLPKDFSDTSIGYSVGTERSAGFDANEIISYVYGNTIEGMLTHSLRWGEGVNIRLHLPDGYWVLPKRNTTVPTIILLVPYIILFVAAIMLRRRRPVEVVEFYPPDDLDPMEMEVVYTQVPNKVIALIPYLANLGYIKIVENEKGTCIEKCTDDWSGLSVYAEEVMEGLFRGKKDSVAITKLRNRFYHTVRSVVSMARKEAALVWDPVRLQQLYILSGTMILIPLLTYFIGCYLSFTTPYWKPIAVLSVLGGLLFMANCKFMKTGTPLAIFTTIMTWWAIIAPVFTFSMYYLVDVGAWSVFYVLFYLIAVFTLCRRKMQRTEEYTDLYGKVLGFRRFIRTAEAPQLRALCSDNPEYFYDILGYAYMFGLEKKWMFRFEQLNLAPRSCSWYSGGDITGLSAMRSLDHMLERTSTMMSSSPSSSSGGGFSGGGFSGGGGGGGGGGAW